MPAGFRARQQLQAQAVADGQLEWLGLDTALETSTVS